MYVLFSFALSELQCAVNNMLLGVTRECEPKETISRNFFKYCA
jgi:hypothetical protein